MRYSSGKSPLVRLLEKVLQTGLIERACVVWRKLFLIGDVHLQMVVALTTEEEDFSTSSEVAHGKDVVLRQSPFSSADWTARTARLASFPPTRITSAVAVTHVLPSLTFMVTVLHCFSPSVRYTTYPFSKSHSESPSVTVQ